MIKALVIAADEEAANSMASILRASTRVKFKVEVENDFDAGLRRLRAGCADCVLLELPEDHPAPADLVEWCVDRAGDCALLVITGAGRLDERMLIEAGAQDVLPKSNVIYPALPRIASFAVARSQWMARKLRRHGAQRSAGPGRSERPAAAGVVGAGDVGQTPKRDVPMGYFQMVGLQNIREALGPRWPLVSDRVDRIIEKLMRDNLREHDTFQKNHSGDYLVMFARSDEKEAQEHATKLERMISSAILGARDREIARPEEKDKPLISDPHMREVAAEVRSSVHQVEMPAHEQAGARSKLANDVARRLHSQIDSIAPDELVQSLYDAGADASLVPMVDRQNRSTSLLMPLFNARVDELVAKLADAMIDTPDFEAALEIDLFKLTRGAELLARFGEDATACGLVDLDYETLAQRRHFDRYRDVCRSLPTRLSRRLLFNVINIPKGTYAPKIARQLMQLNEISRFHAIQMHSSKLDVGDLAILKPPIISIDFADVARELDNRPSSLKSFIDCCHQVRTRVLMRRIPKERMVEMQTSFDIDLLSVH